MAERLLGEGGLCRRIEADIVDWTTLGEVCVCPRQSDRVLPGLQCRLDVKPSGAGNALILTAQLAVEQAVDTVRHVTVPPPPD